MTPIINPWIFYLADTLETLKIVAMFIAGATGLGTLIMYGFSLDEYLDEEELKDYFKKIKKCFIVFVISLIFAIFLPMQDTVYKMLIANYITEDTLTKGKEEAKEMIDYIAEKIDKHDNSDEE